MSEVNNPFVVPGKPPGRVSRGAVIAGSVAAVAAAIAMLALILWFQNRSNHQREMGVLRAELGRTATNLARALTVIQTNRDFIVLLTNQVANLETEKEKAGQSVKTLEEEMREQLESKDVTISKLQGKLTLTIVDRVMFDSGEAILKPDGAAVMEKVAALLAAHPELNIHVIGHTDNIPIRQTAQSRFASNWELSTARSLAAVHFLTEKAGVDPRRVGAVGHGEFLPIADNATAEGRAKNRRIAITILPEELAAADAVPLKALAPTNPSPMTPPEPAQTTVQHE